MAFWNIGANILPSSFIIHFRRHRNLMISTPKSVRAVEGKHPSDNRSLASKLQYLLINLLHNLSQGKHFPSLGTSSRLLPLYLALSFVSTRQKWTAEIGKPFPNGNQEAISVKPSIPRTPSARHASSELWETRDGLVGARKKEEIK